MTRSEKIHFIITKYTLVQAILHFTYILAKHNKVKAIDVVFNTISSPLALSQHLPEFDYLIDLTDIPHSHTSTVLTVYAL